MVVFKSSTVVLCNLVAAARVLLAILLSHKERAGPFFMRSEKKTPPEFFYKEREDSPRRTCKFPLFCALREKGEIDKKKEREVTFSRLGLPFGDHFALPGEESFFALSFTLLSLFLGMLKTRSKKATQDIYLYQLIHGVWRPCRSRKGKQGRVS